MIFSAVVNPASLAAAMAASHAIKPPGLSNTVQAKDLPSGATWRAILPPTQPVISNARPRSEEHTSELQSLLRISYAVFCLKKKKHHIASMHEKHRLLTQR